MASKTRMETMRVEDWFLALIDNADLYLRGCWVPEGSWLNPDDLLTLQHDQTIVFVVDDGINERHVSARWI